MEELGLVGQALEREHREIDQGIAAFTASQAAGSPDPAPLQDAVDALRRHIYLEEEFLFPAMAGSLAIPTLVMLREHGEMWRTLEELEEQLNAGGDLADAAATCKRLLGQTDAHNEKEEPIFYTQTDVELDAETTDELMSFIEAGAMPPGWVCKKAHDAPPPAG